MLATTSTSQQLPEIRARLLDGESSVEPRISNLLAPNEQSAIRQIATIIDYTSGTPVFAEGGEACFVYSVVSGVVRLCRHSGAGRRQILTLMLPGDLFGMPDAGIYVNSAEAICATTLYRVPWVRLRDLLTRQPLLQLSLLNKVTHDLREAQRRIVILGQQNISQRLSSLLLDFVQHPAFFDSANSLVTLPLSRFDIADYLGTAPETVARGFLRLEREGLVRRITSRLIHIRDFDGLTNLPMRKRRVDD